MIAERMTARAVAPLRAWDHRHWHPWPWLCSILARVEAVAMDGLCTETGCASEGVECFFPDHVYPHPPDAILCWEHIQHSGFCRGCGRFWGGVESFEFSRSKLCDDCQHEADIADDIDRDFTDRDWDDDLDEEVKR